jgi:hypothetical protein
MPQLYLLLQSPPLSTQSQVVDNFYGPLTFNTSKGTNCTVVNNTWVPPGAQWPAAALSIMAAAGNVD